MNTPYYQSQDLKNLKTSVIGHLSWAKSFLITTIVFLRKAPFQLEKNP